MQAVTNHLAQYERILAYGLAADIELAFLQWKKSKTTPPATSNAAVSELPQVTAREISKLLAVTGATVYQSCGEERKQHDTVLVIPWLDKTNSPINGIPFVVVSLDPTSPVFHPALHYENGTIKYAAKTPDGSRIEPSLSDQELLVETVKNCLNLLTEEEKHSIHFPGDIFKLANARWGEVITRAGRANYDPDQLPMAACAIAMPILTSDGSINLCYIISHDGYVAVRTPRDNQASHRLHISENPRHAVEKLLLDSIEKINTQLIEKGMSENEARRNIWPVFGPRLAMIRKSNYREFHTLNGLPLSTRHGLVEYSQRLSKGSQLIIGTDGSMPFKIYDDREDAERYLTGMFHALTTNEPQSELANFIYSGGNLNGAHITHPEFALLHITV